MTVFRFVCGIALAFMATAVASTPSGAQTDYFGSTFYWGIPFSETDGSAEQANIFPPLPSEAMSSKPDIVVEVIFVGDTTLDAN